MSKIARVSTVPVRDAFTHEARDLTTWLESNIEALAERLGMTLTVLKREQRAGDFSADLLCEDGEGRRVVVENQLELTDHKHLGQLLTYLVTLEAKVAIWVALDARPEHQRVVEWLNENSPADLHFYLVKVEAIRIAQSPYAPWFSVLAEPSLRTKEIGEQKKEWAAHETARFDFWKSLLEKTRKSGGAFLNVAPNKSHYIKTGTGVSGVAFQCVLNRENAFVELYIDCDQDEGLGNKHLFDRLMAEQAAIEQAIGSSLEWCRLDDKRASRIQQLFSAGYASPEEWAQLQEDMAGAILKFNDTFRPLLQKVR